MPLGGGVAKGVLGDACGLALCALLPGLLLVVADAAGAGLGAWKKRGEKRLE